METATTENIFLRIERQLEIDAPAPIVFASILEEIGPQMHLPDGKSMNMKLEAWPGGRWFRDLGNNTGHLWGHVQVIKPPTLIEICGPMFMSYAATNHVQYRITELSLTRSRLDFIHRAMGDMPEDHRKGVQSGWNQMIDSIAQRAARNVKR